MSLADVTEAMQSGALVVDVRDSAEFAAGHIAGTINIPVGIAFPERLKSLVEPLRRVVLLIGVDEEEITAALLGAAAAGIDNVIGWGGPEIMQHWIKNGGKVMTTLELEPDQAHESARMIVDVRDQSERDEASIPGSRHASLGNLLEKLTDVPKDRPLVLHCQAGTRGAIAASILEANGFTDVANLKGGMDAWCDAGLPSS